MLAIPPIVTWAKSILGRNYWPSKFNLYFSPFPTTEVVEVVTYRPQLFYQIEQDLTFDLRQNSARDDETFKFYIDFAKTHHLSIGRKSQLQPLINKNLVFIGPFFRNLKQLWLIHTMVKSNKPLFPYKYYLQNGLELLQIEHPCDVQIRS